MASGGPPSMNPWEVQALNYEFPDETVAADGSTTKGTWRQVEDPVIYPGLYSASGIDVMSILLQLMSRPNPKVKLGPIDASAALVICDLNLADTPIIYASEAFTELTGYSSREIVGHNCRFLQVPSPGLGSVQASSTGHGFLQPASDQNSLQPAAASHGRSLRSQSKTTKSADQEARQRLSQAVHAREEIQLKITNYKKNGQRFTNILSIIPLPPDGSGTHYAVGLQSALD